MGGAGAMSDGGLLLSALALLLGTALAAAAMGSAGALSSGGLLLCALALLLATAASAAVTGSAGAVSSGGLLPSGLALLLATTAVWWAICRRAARGRQAGTRKLRKHPGFQARAPWRSRGAPWAPRTSRPRESPRKRPDAPASPPCGPCSCGPCVRVAKELRGLMLLFWAPHGTSAPLYSSMWQVLWAQLEQLGKRGHLPCCGSSPCSRRLRPSKRLLPPTMAIPGRASRPSRRFRQRPTIPLRSSGRQRSSIPGASSASDGLQPCKTLPAADHLLPSENLPAAETPRPSEQLLSSESRQPFKILCLPRSFLPPKFPPPSQSITPRSLDASESLEKPFQLVDTEEALDSSPCSLGDQQHLVEIDTTGASQSTDSARESQEEEMGARLEPQKRAQEQVAEAQVSSSHQCPPQGSLDAVPEPAGNSPSPVAETVPRRPWRFRDLQEARPRETTRPRAGVYSDRRALLE